MLKRQVRLIELFAGIGSQAMALRDLGIDFEYYRAIEFDKFAVASYNAIHGTNITTTDIQDIKASDLGIVSTSNYTYLLTYSFPCQDLSLAGNKQGMTKGSGTRSGLLWEVERLLKECKELPQVLLMENVPQVHSKRNIADFESWQKSLKDLGYNNYWFDLNATDVNVPQCRNRCFMVSTLKGYSFNEDCLSHKPGLKRTIKDCLETTVDDKYYLSDKMKEYIMKRGTKTYNAKPEINPNVAHALVSTMTKMHRAGIDNYFTDDFIKAGENEGELEVRQGTKRGYITCKVGGIADLSYPNSKNRRGRVQQGGDLCPNITTSGSELYRLEAVNTMPDGSSRTIKSQYYKTSKANFERQSTFGATGVHEGINIRKLTPRECWRLMSFSDEDFDKAAKVNSNTQLYKQAGNSIVLECLKYIISNIEEE